MADKDFKEPTGMYNTPAAMAEIFKNNREVSDERCKEMRRKSIEKMKNGWGETDVMKKKKKEERVLRVYRIVVILQAEISQESGMTFRKSARWPIVSVRLTSCILRQTQALCTSDCFKQ